METHGSDRAFDYSVVIRTLGTAGAKYRALLASLKAQTVPPREILVVLPEGSPVPPDRLGLERFVSAPRGPVHQREAGMRLARGAYLLVCDDDIEFDPDFVERLSRTALSTGAEVVLPNVLSPEDDEPRPVMAWAKHARDILCGNSYVSSRPSRYAIRIAGTGGYIKKASIEPGRQDYSQSGHGTCSLVKRSAAESLRFDDEIWLEEAGYALPEDQVMFYKAFLQGRRLACCRAAVCRHLDAGSSEIGRMEAMVYAHARNFTVFWHRFMFQTSPSERRRIFLVGCLAFRILNNEIYYALTSLARPARLPLLRTLGRGYVDAFRYLRSDAYRRLPRILDRRIDERALV
ncbi:MAG TPA: glycosyltransferase family 2 protein [Candidatus Bathyarchaeia archaeon]|nr:glycosyltransferase family 2 protein [Candidatus Bathyarchaeia archaeon]